jgi:hypothetical protein
VAEISPPRMLPRLLAEGVAIVIGVLFALAVDRAMTRRDERATERSYLAGIATDLGSMAEASGDAAENARERDAAARVALSFARRTSVVSGRDAARALVLAGFIADEPLLALRESWDDLVGTGRLRVLRDDELRRRISAFYRQIDQLQSFGSDWQESASEYQAIVRRVLEPEMTEAVFLEIIYTRPIPDSLASDAGEIRLRIDSEPEFLTALSEILVINPVAAQSYESMGDTAAALRDDILERYPQP